MRATTAVAATTVAFLLLRAPVSAYSATPAAVPVRVGAIRWDNWNGLAAGGSAADTVRCMSPAPWHSRVPFCGKVVNVSSVDFDCATPEVMRKELAFAAHAGVDYWAFVQYANATSLSVALANYLVEPNKQGINFAALIQTGNLPNPADAEEWAVFLARYDGYFARSEYEVVGPERRPLVFLFGSYSNAAKFGGTPAYEAILQAWVAHRMQRNLTLPHFVQQDAYNDTFVKQLRLDKVVQSRSSYALGDGKVNGSYGDQMAQNVWRWEHWLANGDDVLPLAATGWDPRDRGTGCASWMPHGEGTAWTRMPTAKEVAATVTAAVQWVCNNSAAAVTRHVLVYAWNENSEGGWLLPTLGEGTARIDALAAAKAAGQWDCTPTANSRAAIE